MTRLLAFLLYVWLPAMAWAQTPLSPRETGITPWLGMNMTALRDYEPQRPFINVMTSARPWYGHLPGRWGGWTEADLIAAGALGPHGWPVRVPDEITGISTMLMIDLAPDAGGLAGNYRLTYDGDGRLDIGGGRVGGVRRRGLREIWFSFTPGDGGVELTIRETSESNPIRNIEIVHQDHLDAHARGILLNPDWRARMEGMALLRLMGWQNTNYVTSGRWDARPLPEDYTWTRNGLPLEILIRVANDMGTDPWFTIPHLADDDYIAQMAAMIRDQLDPNLTAWIEFSNETWNWSFPQAHAAAEAAEARWGNRNLWQEWNAMRAAQMVQIFDQVFAGEDHRLRRVLATQTGWLGLEDQLEARHWQAESPDNPPPPELFDVYAITGYFGGRLGRVEGAGLIRDWLSEARDRARMQGRAHGLSGAVLDAFTRRESYQALAQTLFEELLDGRHSGDPGGTIRRILDVYLPYHLAVAQRWGLDLVAYEGGTHLVASGDVAQDAELVAFFEWFNYSEEMGQLYTILLEGCYAGGGGLFTHYSDIRRPGFGILRHLTDDNPRWTALLRFDPDTVRP